jgi:indole-3-pyruvate monooxygenase
VAIEKLETTGAVIVGAGPAGLSVAAGLVRQAIPHVILEKAESVGSSWRKHYDRLHLHTVKRYSSLPYRPFPDHYPRYPSREQVVEYLDSYARHFAIHPRFQQEVITARPVAGGWEIRTADTIFRSRYLVVATGYNGIPNIPDFPGFREFPGQWVHSSIYRNSEPYRGRKVLVVGCGNSGSEIALDLCEGGAETSMVVRGPTHVLPREITGVPNQINAILLNKLPPNIADRIAATVLRLHNGDLSRFGLVTPEVGPIRQVDELGRVPLIDVGTLAQIKAGRLKVKPAVSRFTNTGVFFTDGTSEDFDAVILATGYKARLGRFLDVADRVTDDRGYPLSHGTEAGLKGLFFVGFRNPSTGMLREISLEAVRIAEAIGERRAAA